MARQKDVYDYAAEGAGAAAGGFTGFVAPGAIRNRLSRGRIAAGQESSYRDLNTIVEGKGKKAKRYLASYMTPIVNEAGYFDGNSRTLLPNNWNKMSQKEQNNWKKTFVKNRGNTYDGRMGRITYTKGGDKAYVSPMAGNLLERAWKDGKQGTINPLGGKAVTRTRGTGKNASKYDVFEYDPRSYRAAMRSNIRNTQKSALELGRADLDAVKNRALGIKRAYTDGYKGKKGIQGAWDAFAGDTLRRANRAGKWFGHGSKTNIIGRGIIAGGKPLGRLALTPLSALGGAKITGAASNALRNAGYY